MSREQPLIVDLSLRASSELAAALREGREAVTDAGERSIVVDLGPRRVLAADAANELLLTHRALRAAGGRCVVVIGPALAAQLALAHPEGILWAATRGVALAMLGADNAAPVRAVVRTRGDVVHLFLAGASSTLLACRCWPARCGGCSMPRIAV